MKNTNNLTYRIVIRLKLCSRQATHKLKSLKLSEFTNPPSLGNFLVMFRTPTGLSVAIHIDPPFLKGIPGFSGTGGSGCNVLPKAQVTKGTGYHRYRLQKAQVTIGTGTIGTGTIGTGGQI